MAASDATTPAQPTKPVRGPLAEMLAVAAPVVATMSSYTAMQFVDGLMVSRIGPDAVYVAAQGNGGVAAWLPISMVMGLTQMVNTFVSQHLGAGTPKRGPAYAWAGLWIVLAAWVVLMLPYAAAFPRLLGALADHEPRLFALEVSYARVLIVGSLLTMATRTIAQFFYGMHRPGVVFAAAFAGNLANVVGNTLLIYGPTAPAPMGVGLLDAWFGLAAGWCGRLGIPALGVTGAAVSTVLATGVELLIPMAVFLGRRLHATYATRASWRPSIPHVKDLARLGWPGALMFGNEMICWAYLTVVLIGHFGPAHNTAGWIAMRYMHFAFMPAIGLSIAVTAVVGRCMGAGRPDLAARRTWLGLGLSAAYMGLCAVAFFVFRREAIALFVDPATGPEDRARLIAIGAQVLVAASVFQLFDAVGITMIGALRGAGDTVWPGVVTVLLAWGCLIGGGTYMIHYQARFESLGPWMAASAYIILLGLAVFGRFLRGTWKTIRLVKPESSGAATGAAGEREP